MLNTEQKQAIKRSWELVTPIAETAAELFYKRLFELAPQYRGLFSGDMKDQKRKLIAMLGFIVRSLDWSDEMWRDPIAAEEDMFLIVLALGRRHIDLYRVPDEAYEVVGGALLWTLDYGLGEAFTTETRDAWSQVYRLVSQTMKMGRCAVGSGSKLAREASDA
jgi:hemoglobin-like flavoprotein